MPTLTIKIAPAGAPLTETPNDPSSVGHMWLSLDSDGPSGTANPVSRGFAPIDRWHGFPLAPGFVYQNDDTNYGVTYYSGTIEITESQYSQILAFTDNPANYGFSAFYNGATNSCIDFVYKALEVAGINSGGSYQGDIWPTWNAEDADRVLFSNLFHELTGWDSTRTDNSGYDVYYGSDGDDNLKAFSASPTIMVDAVYGGSGNDTINGSSFKDFLYGGNDNDTLIGGGGNDVLEGGTGNDTYIYTTGDGFDAIMDSDGNIKYDGIFLGCYSSHIGTRVQCRC
jgi:Ca2+-binding RTX toxin-like protein